MSFKSVFVTHCTDRKYDRYLEMQQQKPFISIASAVVDRDYGALIRGTTKDSWKEVPTVLLPGNDASRFKVVQFQVLALLCTYVEDDQFPALCNRLAAHLEGLGMPDAAVSCYMCCANIEKVLSALSKHFDCRMQVVGYWLNSIQGPEDTHRVQSFVERTLVLLHTKGLQRCYCRILCDILTTVL